MAAERSRQAAMLELAKADLASGAYGAAQARAEAVLRAKPSPTLRAAALVVAGDASYAMGAYRAAAGHYGEVLRSDELPPEAAHAALALGWAELRLGRRDEARRAWLRVAGQFPGDPRAPIALLMASELAVQASDTVVGRKLLDRVVENYPATPEAEVARLSRAVLAMREGRTERATDDLRALLRSGHPTVPEERMRILDGLTAGAARGLEQQLVLTNGTGAAAPGGNGRPREHESAARSPTSAQFERLAAPLLDGAGDPETTPRVLHGLVVVAAEDKAWPEVHTLSGHLVDRYPGYQSAPELLVWVAGRAASEQQWPIVRTSYEHATTRYRIPLAPKAQLDFGEALLRTGDTARGRTELTRLLAGGAPAPEAPRALYLLAAANEALDEPREALAAYERLRGTYPHTEWAAESRLPHARLLQHAGGRQEQARVLLEEVVQHTEGDERGEASFRLGQVLAAEGDHERAVDWYMAAAYGTDQRSRWYRPALLGAGRSLLALKRTRAALVVYRNVLPPTPVGLMPRDGRPAPELVASVEEPELAAEAAYTIAELERGAGRNAQAVDLYLTAASLAPESPWRGRALVGAMRSLVSIGDRPSAEGIYRGLAESGLDEPTLAEARKVLQPRGRDTRRGR